MTFINTSRDNIIIRRALQTKAGGVTLDLTGFNDQVIYAGNPIISDDATGEHKPLANDGAAYVALPDGYTFEGVCNKTVLANDAIIGILTAGEVNHKAAHHKYDNIIAPIRTALRAIKFQSDSD